ncbi:MAG: Rod binding domain-containing protein [Chlamydiales bacterium]|jgi:Rod binding domain-containing protein
MQDFMATNTVMEQALAKNKINSFYGAENSQGKDSKDPKKVAAMFEAIFYRLLFKNNRDSMMEDPLVGGQEMNTMKEMRDDEMANNLGSLGHLGIRDMVEEFIEKTQGTNVISPEKFKDRFDVSGGLLKS